MTRSRTMLTGLLVTTLTAAVAVAGSASVSASVPATAAVPTLMTPVGGGYEIGSIEGFIDAAASRAPGPVVRLVVVPSSYGDTAADRDENLELAGERTQQVQDICTAHVVAPFTGCSATLAVLLNRADARDPANSTDFAEADGAYILGGDQTIAMKVLANSPAERAMTTAVARGMVVGGTSAGNAVESRTMLAGYVGDDGPSEGLQRGSVDIWWGDDGDKERGLVFGSRAAIYDQHFFQRGRFGRLLASVAESDEHFDGASRLGVGVDYATGVANLGDRRLGPVFGDSAMAVIDYETLGATHRWVGPEQTLSARNVLVHLLAPGTAAYDIPRRAVTIDGVAQADPRARGWALPALPAGSAQLVLGGDVTSGIPAEAMAAFKSARQGTGRIVVVSASAGDTDTATEYAGLLREAGWTGQVTAVAYGTPAWDRLAFRGATGVVLAGPAPEELLAPMGDPVFTSRVRAMMTSVPVVLADRHMAAAMGTAWDANEDPGSDFEDVAISEFRTDHADWQPGLGIVPMVVTPVLTYDYHWGRLFAAAQRLPRQLSVGISEDTAIMLAPGSAPVSVGEKSVVVVDGRQAEFGVADNGAIQAVNVLMDTFAPGEVVRNLR